MDTTEISVGQFAFEDGTALWTFDATALAGLHLTPGTVATDSAALVELLHHDDRDAVVDAVQLVRPGDGAFTVHYRLQRPSFGRAHRMMLVGAVDRSGDGTRSGVSGYVVDLTTHTSDAERVAVAANNERRASIEQANGAFMVANRLTADEAFALLVSLSSRTNIKVSELAVVLVAEMVRPEHDGRPTAATLLQICDDLVRRGRAGH